jgi:protein CpxP
MQVTRSSKIISGLALCGALLLAGIIGLAQQPTTQGQGRGGDRQWGRGDAQTRPDGEGFGGRMFENLNLTDAQKQQMEQIRARYQETFKSLRQQNRGQRGGGSESDIFNGGTFNESAVRAAAQARANAQVEMDVARAHMMYDMYNVLTADQKAQLAAEHKEREQRRQQFRSGQKNNSGQNQ